MLLGHFMYVSLGIHVYLFLPFGQSSFSNLKRNFKLPKLKFKLVLDDNHFNSVYTDNLESGGQTLTKLKSLLVKPI